MKKLIILIPFLLFGLCVHAQGKIDLPSFTGKIVMMKVPEAIGAYYGTPTIIITDEENNFFEYEVKNNGKKYEKENTILQTTLIANIVKQGYRLLSSQTGMGHMSMSVNTVYVFQKD